MNLYRYLLKYWRCVSHQFALALAGAFVVVGWGCSDFDDSFGKDMIPSSQDSEIRVLDNDSSFTTSLYQSDSIRSSNIGIAIWGAERSVNFGERRGSFFTQFAPVNGLNDDDDDDWSSSYPFGYSPIFDSMVLILTLLDYSGDTTVMQEFEVYEAESVDFLVGHADSIFFDSNLATFIGDGSLTLTNEPIFTFTYPDQDNEIYVASSRVRLHPTGTVDTDNPWGNATSFIQRLLLMDDGADYYMYDWDYRDRFLSKFKGIYIKPVDSYTPPTTTDPLESTGTIYSFATDGMGLGLYGRSLYGEDIPIIKDTINMVYAFRNQSAYELDGDYYGVQINGIERDYMDYTLETNATMLLVEGMGGVVSQITIEEDIFREVYNEMVLSSEDIVGEYNSIFVNQASMRIYLNLSDSDLSSPLVITPYLDVVPYRLGMYTDYTDYYLDADDYDDDISTLTGIEDYYYEYELYYSTVLPFNGYLNRSFGCYNMIISSQFQEAWNSYLDAVDAAGGDPDAVEFEDVEERTFYLAPVADNLYTLAMARLQGMEGGGNSLPISLKLTYTLIKDKTR